MKSSSKGKFSKSNDRFVAGVAGGIAEYFGWNKAVTRMVILILIVLSHGLLLIPYFILAWLMPSAPIDQRFQQFFNGFSFNNPDNSQTKSKNHRKEIKDVEEHDVNE